MIRRPPLLKIVAEREEESRCGILRRLALAGLYEAVDTEREVVPRVP